MKVPDIHDLFQARTPAARQALDEFETRRKAYEQEISSFALTILVWGAGLTSESEATKKRWQILFALAEDGHAVLFSEGIPGSGLTLGSEELAQARAAHLIIVLLSDDSKGAIEEVARICTHPEIAWKALVFAPRSFQTGFLAGSSLQLLDRGYGGLKWYSDEELRRCEVVAASRMRAEARREVYAVYATM